LPADEAGEVSVHVLDVHVLAAILPVLHHPGSTVGHEGDNILSVIHVKNRRPDEVRVRARRHFISPGAKVLQVSASACTHKAPLAEAKGAGGRGLLAQQGSDDVRLPGAGGDRDARPLGRLAELRHRQLAQVHGGRAGGPRLPHPATVLARLPSGGGDAGPLAGEAEGEVVGGENVVADAVGHGKKPLLW